MNLIRLFGATLGGQPVYIPTGDATSLLTNGLNLAYFAAGITAVVIIVFAGYNYAMAAGDAAKTKKALWTIVYTSIGLAIIILAFAITNFVVGRV